MIEVGQKLWMVPRDDRSRRFSRFVTVEKIGRRWAKLADNAGRVDMEDLTLDGAGYSSPGRCYLSREAWIEAVKTNESWIAFVKLVRETWTPPDLAAASPGTIEYAASLLFGPPGVAKLAAAQAKVDAELKELV